jgi:hypothetical protein
MKKTMMFLGILAVAMLLMGCVAKQTDEEAADGDADDLADLEDGFEIETDDEDVADDEEAEEEAEEEASEDDEAPVTATPAAPIRSETKTAGPTTLKKITVTEGDVVSVDVKGTDPDGDKLTYTFSTPLNSQGKWQTKRGDAGIYHADVTATDGKTSVTKTIEIEVTKSNQPPTMEKLKDITVEEGDTVSLDPKVTDPDGDKVTLTYSGWMTSASKTTGYDDSGNYVVTVTATDGEYEVSQDVKVTVTDVNRAPDFEVVLS